MKYSILIPYRNREPHIKLLIPKLEETFESLTGGNYEIIISEQNDNDNFTLGCLQNAAFQECTGDVIVLHHVDYYPVEDVDYKYYGYPTIPVRYVFFLDRDFQSERPVEDIPPGYRHFSKGVDENFLGGVVIMSREHYEKINGFNNLYRGWGNEDEDLRERLFYYNLPPKRHEKGTFYSLYHRDNGDMSKKEPIQKKDFLDGREMLRNFSRYLKHGYRNLVCDKDRAQYSEKIIWLKCTNFKSIAQ